jgi:rhodanese-related sulfurtransferase
MSRLLEFAANHPLLVGTGVLLALAALAVELKRAARPWREVGPFEATQLINDGALLLDLRDGEAHRTGHIAGSIPATLAELERAVAAHPKDAAVVAYCESGATSGRAAARLVELGYGKVASLRGGVAGWRAENLPLATG